VLPACTGEFFAAALKHYDIISVFALCHQAVTIIAVHMLDFLSIAHYTFFAGTGLRKVAKIIQTMHNGMDKTENGGRHLLCPHLNLPANDFVNHWSLLKMVDIYITGIVNRTSWDVRFTRMAGGLRCGRLSMVS